MTGLGWVDVGVSLLREILNAPADSVIVGAEFQSPYVVWLLFRSDDLPSDGPIRVYSPTIEMIPGGYVWSWGEGQ